MSAQPNVLPLPSDDPTAAKIRELQARCDGLAAQLQEVREILARRNGAAPSEAAPNGKAWDKWQQPWRMK